MQAWHQRGIKGGRPNLPAHCNSCSPPSACITGKTKTQTPSVCQILNLIVSKCQWVSWQHRYQLFVMSQRELGHHWTLTQPGINCRDFFLSQESEAVNWIPRKKSVTCQNVKQQLQKEPDEDAYLWPPLKTTQGVASVPLPEKNQISKWNGRL